MHPWFWGGLPVFRIGLCGLLAVGLWWLSAYGRHAPVPLGPDAPATQFSAARANAMLGRLLGHEQPHPIGSPQAALFRARLLRELRALGIPATSQESFSCYSEPRWGAVECGQVTNIQARLSTGTGKQLLLMTHTDSVGAGPGAADNGAGVVTVLESLRALKARGLTGTHGISAQFNDGEEAGMLGAAAWVRDAAARDATGVVVNNDARGTEGPTYLFQTSAGNAPLVDLYARSVRHYAASSLYGEIYKYLPNDTDLTPVLGAGLPGVNFAFIGGVARHHTPLDNRANLSPVSLQQDGEGMLEMADALSHADLPRLKGEDAVYLDILGRWLPRLPQGRVLPLAWAALAMMALAGLLTRRERHAILRPWQSFLMPPLLLVLAVGLGFVLHNLAAWISGHADPSFAHPWALRLSLAFGVFAAASLTARGAGAVAGWLWFAGAAVACALWAPGAAPYFLFPSLVAAPLLLVTARGGREPALWLAALAGLVVWMGLAAGTEQIGGLMLHPLFMVTAGCGLIALLPVLGKARKGLLTLSFAVSLLLALVFAVVAGFLPAYSATSPQRLNIRYVQNGGHAWWVADAVPRLPDALRAAGGFSDKPQTVGVTGYAAPAGPPRLPLPTARVSRVGDSVMLDVSTQGDGFEIRVPREAGLAAVAVNGVAATPPQTGPITITCAGCRDAHLALTLTADQTTALQLTALWRGLPPGGAKLQRARPDWAVPSQDGDVSLAMTNVAVPAR